MVRDKTFRKVKPASRKQVQGGKRAALQTLARRETDHNLRRHVVTMNANLGRKKFSNPRFKRNIKNANV